MLDETGLYVGLKVKNEKKFILECKTSYIFVKLKKKRQFFSLSVYEHPSFENITKRTRN